MKVLIPHFLYAPSAQLIHFFKFTNQHPDGNSQNDGVGNQRSKEYTMNAEPGDPRHDNCSRDVNGNLPQNHKYAGFRGSAEGLH